MSEQQKRDQDRTKKSASPSQLESRSARDATAAVREFAKELGTTHDDDFTAEAERFVDYWISTRREPAA